MVYATGEDKGYGRQCDAAHPYLIPDMQFQWHYTVDANFQKGLWRLSSDDMMAQMGHPVVPGADRIDVPSGDAHGLFVRNSVFV